MLAIAACSVCLVLHLTTFVTVVPVFWLMIPFGLTAGVVICSEAAGIQRKNALISAHGMGLVNALLLVYAVLTYACVLWTNGWTSNVSVLNGQYVAMYHGRVTRTITAHEYGMFPTLWTRAMSAVGGTIASAGITHLSD